MLTFITQAIYNSIKEKILCGSKRKLDTDHQGLNVCKKIKYEDESNIKVYLNLYDINSGHIIIYNF